MRDWRRHLDWEKIEEDHFRAAREAFAARELRLAATAALRLRPRLTGKGHLILSHCNGRAGSPCALPDSPWAAMLGRARALASNEREHARRLDWRRPRRCELVVFTSWWRSRSSRDRSAASLRPAHRQARCKVGAEVAVLRSRPFSTERIAGQTAIDAWRCSTARRMQAVRDVAEKAASAGVRVGRGCCRGWRKRCLLVRTACFQAALLFGSGVQREIALKPTRCVGHLASLICSPAFRAGVRCARADATPIFPPRSRSAGPVFIKNLARRCVRAPGSPAVGFASKRGESPSSLAGMPRPGMVCPSTTGFALDLGDLAQEKTLRLWESGAIRASLDAAKGGPIPTAGGEAVLNAESEPIDPHGRLDYGHTCRRVRCWPRRRSLQAPRRRFGD